MMPIMCCVSLLRRVAPKYHNKVPSSDNRPRRPLSCPLALESLKCQADNRSLVILNTGQMEMSAE